MKKIIIYDFDDTLVETDGKIIVKCTQNGTVFELSPQEFNRFEGQDYHQYDFTQFENYDVLRKGRFIKHIKNLFERDLKSGEDVAILTARGNKNIIHRFLKENGFVLNKRMIFTVGDKGLKYTGPCNIKKKNVILKLISKGYEHFVIYEDSLDNILAIKSLDNKKTIKTDAFLVKNNETFLIQ